MGLSRMVRAGGRALCAVLVLAACGHARPRTTLGPPPSLPEQRRAARLVVLPEWYWEPVDVAVSADPKVVDLPASESALVRVEGATRVWAELGAEGRERLRRDGLVVLGAGPERPIRTQMGAFYMETREQRVPYVVTLDALGYAVHVAFERALAEVDETLVAPQLDGLLVALEKRLGAEQHGAGVETSEALRLARSIVAVARTLATESPAAPPDLGPAVAQELAHVLAHEKPAPSALLGVTIDYARFAVPSGAGRPGAFRAMTWLANAPLLLVAQTEGSSTRGVDVAAARLNARAAMLLARVGESDVDPAIHAAWSRLTRLASFLWGTSDDLSGAELVELAAAANVPLENPKNIASVVAVDRVRRRAAQGRLPKLFDGSGTTGRAGVAMRVLGGHAPADSIALASLVSIDGGRPVPSTLDLAAWLGAPGAREALRDDGADSWPGYDAALARAIAMRPDDDAPSRHASVYGSLLDVVMTWLAPSRASSPAAQRAAIESALASWTYARHDGRWLSRPRPARAAHARPPRDLHVSGAALPAFVEPEPEVIARLVATVGQMKRGLAAVGGLPPTSNAMTTLAEVDDILRAVMVVAVRELNDDELEPDDVSMLASLPARLARLEEGDDPAAAAVPLVAEVFSDASGDHVLSAATGAVEPVVRILREPGSGRLLLTVGAHVAHHELVEKRREQSTDASYRARRLPDHLPYTSSFRLTSQTATVPRGPEAAAR